MKLIILLAATMCAHSIYVNTSYGSVHGILHPIVSDVEVFRGIPYAKPPIGNLRWKKPLPIENWGKLNASSFRQMCMQPDFLFPIPREWMSEDCLYLNIYRPTGNHTKLPVMIWIHGGAYRIGAGQWSDGDWLAKKDVIVVTINYRLGIFGFANTGDNLLPGNYGLLDQHEAIVFTKNIIASFGGNPQKITIFGESAGGGSVILQLLSPLSPGLIQKGISQSPGISYDEPLVSKKYLNDVCSYLSSDCVKGISGPNIENVIAILKNATTQELFDAVNSTSNIYFGPVPNDGIFFPTDVRETIMSKDVTCYDFIAGWNNRDGDLVGASPSMKVKNVTELQALMGKNVWMGGKFNQRQAEVAFEHYNQTTSPLGWEKFFLDVMFVRNALLMADALMSSGCNDTYDTYVYQFSYNVPVQMFKTTTPGGASHADDLQYLFRQNRTLSDNEQNLSNMLLTHWTRFAHGLPLEDWPKYNSQRMIYNIINATNNNILSGYPGIEFWTTSREISDSTEGPPTEKPEESGAGVRPTLALYLTILLGIISYHIL